MHNKYIYELIDKDFIGSELKNTKRSLEEWILRIDDWVTEAKHNICGGEREASEWSTYNAIRNIAVMIISVMEQHDVFLQKDTIKKSKTIKQWSIERKVPEGVPYSLYNRGLKLHVTIDTNLGFIIDTVVMNNEIDHIQQLIQEDRLEDIMNCINRPIDFRLKQEDS